MAKILGLGGVFLKVDKKTAYTKWWKTHMGVDISEWGSMEWANDGKAYTVLCPFDKDSDYFDGSDAPFMINLRVDDVRAMRKKAKAGGAKMVGEISDEGYGIFAWFLDPQGIKVELWQDTSDSNKDDEA